MGDEKRGPVLELLLTKLRFTAATHAAAAAGEAGVEPLPDFTGQLQVGTPVHSGASCCILLPSLRHLTPCCACVVLQHSRSLVKACLSTLQSVAAKGSPD